MANEVRGRSRTVVQTVGGGKYFDFERATVFSSGHRLSKHKMTRYARNLEGTWPSCSPGYVYGQEERFYSLIMI